VSARARAAREERESDEGSPALPTNQCGKGLEGVAVPMNKSGRDSDGREMVSAPGPRTAKNLRA